MPPKTRSVSRGRAKAAAATPTRKRSTSRKRSVSRSSRAATPRKSRTTTRSPAPRRRAAAKAEPEPPVSPPAEPLEVPELMKPLKANGAASRNGSARNGSVYTGSTNKLFILAQMLACVGGIYFCFSMWSLKQERLMTMPYNIAADGSTTDDAYFPTVFGVSAMQNAAGFAVALLILSAGPAAKAVLARVLKGKKGGSTRQSKSSAASPLALVAALSRKDLRELVTVGFSTAFGTTLGYAAMRRLPFPVVLATKMSKMVPVMVVGFVCYRTRYSARKVLSCLLITVGVMAFYLLNNKGQGESKASGDKAAASSLGSGAVGFLLLFLNLFLDGFSNSTQDVLVKEHGWSATTLMLLVNLFSAAWGVAVLLFLELPLLQPLLSAVLPRAVASQVAFRDLSTTSAFLRAYPAAWRDLLAMSLLNAVGQIFIFQTIALFGTLTLTAMTLVRKAGSVLLSIFVNGHAVSRPQWAALSLVMGSVVFEAHVNITETAEKRQRQQQHLNGGGEEEEAPVGRSTRSRKRN